MTANISLRNLVKVLYTFDDQNKTNCLTRWPQALDIRTAYLDESTQIGVIELKTCLQAIVSASPELVAKLGQDYTVYAYDYSEYETPLVGQGMLSWALASASSTPAAPAHQSKTMVTGRVCKSILGLFPSTSQETLEVKLRLVPVPTCLQSEYIESMNKYRDISRIMPEGFDAGAWTAFLQANPGILQSAGQSRSQTPSQGLVQREGMGIEHVQRLLSQGSTINDTGGIYFGAPKANEQPGRASSPATSVKSMTAPKRRGRPPKNGLKTTVNVANTQKKASLSQMGADGGYLDGDDRTEEGPIKKRAKITKADMPSKATFGQQPESLRVAASTAASVRIHQPTAIRPPTNGAHALEGPPRAPTPIEDPAARIKRPSLLTARSSLRRESLIADDRTYESPYALSETGTRPPESAFTSPEASRIGSLGETPADIGSSPPVYRDASTAPSSPRLPVYPKQLDSGYMSGTVDELFDDEELRPLDDEDLELASQYCRRPDLPPFMKAKEAPHLPNAEARSSTEKQLEDKAIALSRKSARNAVGLGRTASSGALPRPSAAASDPIRPSSLCRSQSWAGHQQPHNGPDVPAADNSIAPSPSETKVGSDSGSGAQRRKAIQNKLASSIAAGQVPPFCENCGAIETPTWRKAWVKTHSGTPEHVRISDDQGGILMWQTLQTDENGIVCLYRIFKKSLLPTDEGFSEILLCNRKSSLSTAKFCTNCLPACGLWLHNRKCLRPKENWGKPKKNPDEKRKRKRPPRKQSSRSVRGGAGSEATEAAGSQPSDASSPVADTTGEDIIHMSPQLPVFKKRRALSVQLSRAQRTKCGLDNASAAAALHRAIQSSPARLTGTQNAPIPIADLTPRPTRRLLFPSPSQSNSAKLDDSLGSPIAAKEQTFESNRHRASVDTDDEQADKENCPPMPDENEAYDDLFEEEPRSNTRPTTPTSASKALDQTFKTPRNNSTPHRGLPKTGDFFSSTAKALLNHPITPRRNASTSAAQPLGEMTPFTAHLNQLFSDANGSPSANFDFPSLPSLHNTPGRVADSYDFSHFDSQDFLSTDVPMPSSPPVWFGVYEDPIESGGAFSDYPLPEMQSSPFNADTNPA